ncbi:MAG: MarR family winged helix-turn-helix transcriptional regulator [Mycobacteriales bacterium]
MAEDPVLSELVRALNDLYRLSGSAKVHADTVRSTGVQVTQTGLRFLSLIADSPRISATDLAGALDVSQPTASRVLQQLETEQLVVRHASELDGRVSHYVVSSKGRKALAAVHGYHVDRLAFALGDSDTAQRKELVAAVTALVGRLHEAQQASSSKRTA